MSGNNDKLDALVSSMEQEWCEHYHPEALDSMSEKTQTQPSADSLSETCDEAAPALEGAAVVPEPFFDEEDRKILERLSESDWEMLDDEAVEALARELAKEEAEKAAEAQSVSSDPVQAASETGDSPCSDEEEIGPNSFRIGAFDQSNAPIPPLRSQLDALEREPTIVFKSIEETVEERPVSPMSPVSPVSSKSGQKGIEDIVSHDRDVLSSPWSHSAETASEPIVTDTAPLEPMNGLDLAPTVSLAGEMHQEDDAHQEAPETFSASLPETETLPETASFGTPLSAPLDAVADRTIDQLRPTEPTRSELERSLDTFIKQSKKDKGEENKPQITLTVRKASQDSDRKQTRSATPETQPTSVVLTSATEDDWYKALASLTGDPVIIHPETGLAKEMPLSDPVASLNDIPTGLSDIPALDVSDRFKAIESELAFDDEITSAPSVPVEKESNPLMSAIALTDPLVDLAETAEKPVRAAQSESEPLIHEHAPLGFMPDMISFSGLDLVEAEPDLPSATDLLLEQAGKATPAVELVEPVELEIRENGKVISLSEIEDQSVRVAVEQIAASRKSGKKAESDKDDISLLNELSGHHLVDAEDYAKLKMQDTRREGRTLSEREITQSDSNLGAPKADTISFPVLPETSSASEGIADAFFAYDDETRLALLQSILAESLVDVAAQTANARQWRAIDEDKAQELVSARFSNDRIRTADLMHDISGHRRLQMTQLLQDKGGEALVVYLYSIGLDDRSTLSMLLHGPDAISHDYAKVAQLMTLYNQLYPAAADKIIAQLFGTPRRVQIRHQTLHDDGAGIASARLRTTGLESRHQSEEKTTPEFGRRHVRPGDQK